MKFFKTKSINNENVLFSLLFEEKMFDGFFFSIYLNLFTKSNNTLAISLLPLYA